LVTGPDITSVFDWGSSMYGDHLYDVAWLTFCAPYTVGFDRLEMRSLARAHHVNDGIDPDDFDQRVECYELHIGLGALIYQAFLGNHSTVQWLCTLITQVMAGSTGEESAPQLT
jgi:aminoglycoside phosphotransferase (APT) family kinase protein